MSSLRTTQAAALAPAASRELAAREKHWPAAVDRGELTQAEADADIAAWRAIAALLGGGGAETELGWPDLVEAADRAIARRYDAAPAATAPGHPDNARAAALEARLGTVRAIRQALVEAAWSAGAFAYRHDKRSAA